MSCLQGCSSVLYFEARKHKDLYLWAAKSPAGPSVKFHVTNGALKGRLEYSACAGAVLGKLLGRKQVLPAVMHPGGPNMMAPTLPPAFD